MTQDILRIVLRHARANEVHRVERIDLEIGALSDLEEEWIQHYFSRIAAGTPAAGAQLKVSTVPCRFVCRDCGEEFTAELAAELDDEDKLRCPVCSSSSIEMFSGDEYRIKSMEAL